jgi:hypothetical protein
LSSEEVCLQRRVAVGSEVMASDAIELVAAVIAEKS